MDALLTCPRKHFWAYEIGLRPISSASALRFGSAWHRALEARWQGMGYDDSLESAVPDGVDLDELQIATLGGLLAGYFARYKDNEIVKSVHAEIEFRQGLSGSRTFDVAGKIDGLGILVDERLALIESKTTSDSVEPSSDYWLRLRFNTQVFQYVLAARSLGWDVSTVIYDVTRKPAIRQKQNETVEEFGQRLAEDSISRPEFYFARREVPILEQDLVEFQTHRLTLTKLILHCRSAERKLLKREAAWPRNISTWNCQGCAYNNFCLQSVSVDLDHPPTGFRIGEANPELAAA
jgi:hypothetical protein